MDRTTEGIGLGLHRLWKVGWVHRVFRIWGIGFAAGFKIFVSKFAKVRFRVLGVSCIVPLK